MELAPASPVPLPGAPQTLQARRDAARSAANDFEAVFVAQMMEPMFKGVSTDGMFGGGNGEQIFRSLMIQEVGKEISAGGGIGVSDAIYREMLRLQGLEG